MNCEECKEHLLEYAWGELPDTTSQQIAAALEKCPQCRQELDRIQQTRDLWRQSVPDQELPSLARANILRQARLHADTLQDQQRSPWTTLATWLMHPAVASVAAVAVLIVIGLIFFQDNTRVHETAPAMAEKADEAPTVAMADDAKAEEAKEAEVAEAKVAPEPAAAAPAAEVAEAEPLDLDGQQVAQLDEEVQDLVQRQRAPGINRRSQALERDQPAAAPAANGEWARDLDKAPVDRGLSVGNMADGFEVAAKDDKLAKEAQKPLAPSDNEAEGGAVALKSEAQEGKKDEDPGDGEQAADLWRPSQQTALAPPSSRSLAAGAASGRAGSSSLGLGSGSGGGLLPKGGSTQKQAYTYGVDSLNAPEAQEAPGEAAQGLSQELAQQRFQEGMDRYNRADYAGAIEDFNAFMNEAPRSSNYHALALYHRGLSELRQGNAAAAASSLRKVLTEHPDSEKRDEARYWLARALQRIDPEDAEARQILEQLSEGRGGMAGEARDQLQRSYGRQDKKAAPKRSSKKKTAPSKVNDTLYDMEQRANEPAPSNSSYE